MRFHRKPPPVRKLMRRVLWPWDPPETEFPAIVPVATLPFERSGQTAVAITGVWAYSNGFEFLVTRLIRPDAPGFDEDPVPDAPRGIRAERQSFQISLQLADGSKVLSGRSGGDAEPAGPILRSRGGGGSSHRVVLRWWAWPLPASGQLTFICSLGSAKTQVTMDAQLILDAS